MRVLAIGSGCSGPAFAPECCRQFAAAARAAADYGRRGLSKTEPVVVAGRIGIIEQSPERRRRSPRWHRLAGKDPERPAGLWRWHRQARIARDGAALRRGSPVSEAVGERVVTIGRRCFVRRNGGKRSPVSKAIVEGFLTIGRKYVIGRNERHGGHARIKEGLRFTGDAPGETRRGLPGSERRGLIRWRVKRSGRRHVRCTGRVAKYSAGIGAGVPQILLVILRDKPADLDLGQLGLADPVGFTRLPSGSHI
jgi:hypothetical protein